MASNLPDLPENDFWSENLQQSIQAAGQQGKTLLCFVTDISDDSNIWNDIIRDRKFEAAIRNSTIRLRLHDGTQDLEFLRAVCPVQNIPALVLIKNGQIEERLDVESVTSDQLKDKLAQRYAPTDSEEITAEKDRKSTTNVEQCIEFVTIAGRMRLPVNAYDALREQTEKLQLQNISPKNILQLQMRLLDNIPTLRSQVKDIREREPGTAPVLSDDTVNRLLNTPASMLQSRQSSPSPATSATTATPVSRNNNSSPGTTSVSSPTPPPASTTAQATTAKPQSSSQPRSASQQAQRADYLRQQRERETAQRTERDRIKAQIKADREERRRLDSIRKQSELSELRKGNSTTSTPSSTDIRIQVRTFDGSTLRTTFPRTATISDDVRPWIDEVNNDVNKPPYNLKMILTPLPNRNIEASEEEQTLPDLGIVGSATLVMVPVQGYVDSYAGAPAGIAGTVIGGLMGAGGRVVSGALGILGWGSSPATSTPQASMGSTAAGNVADREGAASSGATSSGATSSGATAKVHTLADQRAEAAKKRGTQLYNGNSLDFQGRKDDDDRKKD